MPLAERRWRIALTIVLTLYGIWCGATLDRFHFPDAIDLPIHETGHIVFSWGGDVLTSLGGTLFQLLIPVVFVIYFWRRKDRHAASVALWWVGQNFFNISRYIADARAQELPLVGGGEHDWTFLLATWRLLPQDLSIAYDVRGLGFAIIGMAAWIGWLSVVRAPIAEPPIYGEAV